MYSIGKLRLMTKPDSNLFFPFHIDPKAMAGCHDQVGHLGQDRVLELLRDRFFGQGCTWMLHSTINSCPGCIKRKSQPDTAPLHNIETTQPLELIHLDYLFIIIIIILFYIVLFEL